MNPRVIHVQAQDDYSLLITFENGEVRLFDATPYLDKGIFHELKEFSYFRQVKVVHGSIEWPHEQDFSYDTLYLCSILTE